MSWLLLPGGVVMPDVRPAKSFTGEHTDPAYDMQVRARHKEYLDSFRELYCPEMLESLHFPNHDYPWKAYVRRADLAAAYGKTVMAIDYRKFKPESVAKHPTDSTRSKYLLPWKKANQLHSLYNSLWGTMLHHGDGTSVFNQSSLGYMTRPTGSLDKPNPGYCSGISPTHWFPSNLAKPGQPEKCFDCGTDKAAFIKERDAKRKAAKPKGTTSSSNYGGPAGSAGSITYPGSTGWDDPAWDKEGPVFPKGTSAWQDTNWGAPASASSHGLGFPTPAGEPDTDDPQADEEAYWDAVESAPAGTDVEDFAGIIERASTYDLRIWANEMPEIADAAQAELDSREDALRAAESADMPPAPAHPGQSRRSQKRARRAARRRQHR